MQPSSWLARSQQWLGSLPAACVVALISVSYAVSYAVMIFGSSGSALLQAGLPLLFVTSVLGLLAISFTSSLPFMVGGADSNSVGLLSLMVGGITGVMQRSSMPAAEILATVFVAIALSTVLVGLLLTLLGVMRRGNLVLFVPFPVVGGFLAGTGYLLWTGAFTVLTGHALTLDTLRAGIALDWRVVLPVAIVLVGMLGLPGRKFDHPLALPASLALACVAFFASLAASGVSFAQARALGWMFEPLSAGNVQLPVSLSWRLIHWDILLRHYGEFLALTAVTTLAILLNATGVSLATRREVDFNRELRSAGIANIVTGLFGGVVGCHSLSRTLLNYRFGSRDRQAAVIAAILCLLCALFFIPWISYFPKPVLAGLLLGLGAGLLNEWLIKARRLSRGDYFLIVLILAVVAWYGFVTGVALGVVVACMLFVVDYGRVSCVKMEFTGASLHSKLERPVQANAELKRLGQRVFGMRLQGFLFFGSANQIVHRVREQLQSPRKYIIIDFRHVQGLDASTSQSFVKLAQVCEQFQVTLILTGITERIRRPIARAAFHGTPPKEFADLDLALEWVEDRLLEQGPLEQSDHGLHVSLAEHFDAPQLASLFSRMETVDLEAGTLLFRKGDAGDSMYFIEEGLVSISLPLEEGGAMRLRSFGNATIVGEMALYRGQHRTADVVTDRPTRAHKLTLSTLRQLEREDPATALRLHSYVVKVIASRLESTNEAYRLAY
ncbi:SLC26A/SulP transporter family protein [Herbaspirillum sp. NPDC087042]|uniref:SLC26A/SulP transporter family protein n=1 Tax=Herbaspirillum sp. NPDC087042 TaxID=3364004 RepID=UPI00382CBA07